MPLNTSDFDSNCSVSIYSSKFAPATDIGVGLAILSVVLLSVLGNGLVLLTSYRRRNKIAGSEVLCVYLAVLDFLCCVCIYPLFVLSSFNHGWMGSSVTCTYYGLGCYFFGLCSISTITAISITRCLKTCYSRTYTGANIQLILLGTWGIATVWSCLPLLGWGEYNPEPYGLSCTVSWRSYHTSFKSAVYVTCSFTFFCLVPFLVILVSQGHILVKVYHLSSRLPARRRLQRTEKRLSLIFFCITMGFVVAWAPYAVVSMLFIFRRDHWGMAPSGFLLPALFAKCSHIYNPIIYFSFNKAFRRELLCLTLSLCPCMKGNWVGAASATGGLQAPHPIQIQLQDQNQEDLDQDPVLRAHLGFLPGQSQGNNAWESSEQPSEQQGGLPRTPLHSQ